MAFWGLWQCSSCLHKGGDTDPADGLTFYDPRETVCLLKSSPCWETQQTEDRAVIMQHLMLMTSLFSVTVQPHDGACGQGNSYITLRCAPALPDVFNVLYFILFLSLFLPKCFHLLFQAAICPFLCGTLTQKHNQTEIIVCVLLTTACDSLS